MINNLSSLYHYISLYIIIIIIILIICSLQRPTISNATRNMVAVGQDCPPHDQDGKNTWNPFAPAPRIYPMNAAGTAFWIKFLFFSVPKMVKHVDHFQKKHVKNMSMNS